MQVENISDTLNRITFSSGTVLTLIGTAHISSSSVDEVRSLIEKEKPDSLSIELDEARLAQVENRKNWQEMDMVKVFKEKKGFLLLATSALSSFQKRMGDQTGIKPGSEFIEAAKLARENNIPLFLCDRPVNQTLRRAWAKSSLWNKSKLLATLLASAFSKEKISDEELEELKKQESMEGMLNEVAKELPSVKEVLIDERDVYLATKIYNAGGNNKIAIIGAGHTLGVISTLEKLDKGEKLTSVEDLEKIPPTKPIGKILEYLVPSAIILLLVLGIVFNGWNQGLITFLYWVLTNVSCTLLMTLLALAHPLNILACAITAPIFALVPVLGVGMLGGVLEATLKKPKVKDFEHMSEDSVSLKGWYNNKFLHCLLVFFLSSIGSVVGTLIAFPVLISRI